MGLVEPFENVSPAALAHATGLVELAERGNLLGGEETDAPPQGVAYEHGEAMAVPHDGLGCTWRQLLADLPAASGGATSTPSALPAALHSSTRLESVVRTTNPSQATMSSRRSVRLSSGTVLSSTRQASER